MLLTKRIATPDGGPLDGVFYGWADPRGDNPTTGQYPLIFHAPDFDAFDYLSLPVVREVQIAAFAHTLTAYATDAEYTEAQKTTYRLAAECCIPTGTFPPKDNPDAPPAPYALYSGHVVRTKVLTNPATGLRFQWARIRTLGGELDVVADPATVEGTLAECGVATGTFWLTGRIVDLPKSAVQ